MRPKKNGLQSGADLIPANISSLKDLPPIHLLKPGPDRGKFLLESLKKRKTTREISEKKLSLQILSDLLWAACGVNRKTGPFGIPGRTAATASNSQEIELYVALEEGVYQYDAFHSRLLPVVAGDLRSLAIGPRQPDFAVNAPVHIIFVADIDKLIHTSGYAEPGLLVPEIQKSYYFVDTGIIAGNVYLFAASRGLAAWFHNCNKPILAKKLKLRGDQEVLFSQTVGYPANSRNL